MSIRCLLIIGGVADERAAVAERLADIAELTRDNIDGGILFATKRQALTRQGPWVVGDLFDEASHVAPVSSAAPEPSDVVRRYWGRYIAIWASSSGAHRIVRDPSGALPCYYRSTSSGLVIASDLALLEVALPSRRWLDWGEIARILGAGDLRSPRTAIADVRELPPGHQLTVERNRATESVLWDPWRFAGQRSQCSFEDNAAALRRRIDTVISAFAQDHSQAVATMSGGLDSSIVALSLAPVIGKLTGVTATTSDPSGDERRYARIVAQAGSMDLHERSMDAGDIHLMRSQVEHLPRPVGRPFFQTVARLVADTVDETSASAIFNGTGGDNVFCFLQSATPVVDCIRAGSLAGAWRTARNIAAMTNASYGDVAKATLRKLSASREAYRWRDDRRFLSAAQAELAAAFEHPWLQPPPAALPGQLAHIAMLLRVQNYLEPWFADDPVEIINPLLAQPIVELCLGIPSWQWCRGGVDRAVARAAFADRLPADILRRSWKGGPDSFVGTFVDRNRVSIRAQLLGGELDEQGLLDRDSLAAVLADPRPFSASDALRLLALTDTEAWVRHQSQVAHGAPLLAPVRSASAPSLQPAQAIDPAVAAD